MNVNDESYQKQEKVRGTRKCPTPGCDSSSNTNPLRKSHISQNYCPIFTSSNKSFRTNESDKENELSDLLEKVKIKKAKKMSSKPTKLKQPKLEKLIRQRSPSSSCDERPAKKFASTTASESDSDVVRSKKEGATNVKTEKSLNKLVNEKLDAKIFKDTKIDKTKTSGSESSPVKQKASVSTPKTDKKVPSIFQSIKKEGESVSSGLADEICEKRARLFSDITEFRFNKKRVKVLTEVANIPDDAEAILYWMSREQRVQDNWSLLYAQKLAFKRNLPLVVCFCLVPTHLGATLRHYQFMIEGLIEVEKELKELNIPFVLLTGQAKDQIPKFVADNKIGGVICDFTPLRVPLGWVAELKEKLPQDIPFAQIDGHNIVPCWFASDKQEYAARTIRNKINSKLDDFLTEFPPLIKHPHDPPKAIVALACPDWDACYKSLKCDMDVKVVDWAKPGYKAGIKVLEDFIKSRVKIYDTERNDPNKNALSNLSPWTHFGQISAQRCAIEVKKHCFKANPKAVAGFLEESVVRRELAENYCYYQPNYDNINGAYEWARKTLEDHRDDKRPYVYTYQQLDDFKSHDRLWNAAQIQLRAEGKMHGFLRMYWAKKILEWTQSPEQALEYAIKLNDRYSLDGRDSAGYVGCMWSICGIHDQGWAERAVFGKIRYMNYDGCKRKFTIDHFINKYYARKHLA